MRWSASDPGGSGIASFTLEVRDASSPAHRWRTVPGYAATRRRSLRYRGRDGHTYAFRVHATGNDGVASAWATSTTVTPSGVFVPGGRYSRGWRVYPARGAWEGRTIRSSTRGATLALAYLGGDVAIVGERSPTGGRVRVTLDGRERSIDTRAGSSRRRVVLYRARVRIGRHRLTLTVLGGTVALEGVAITARRG